MLMGTYHSLLAKGEKVVADEIFFGTVDDFMGGGLWGTTFWTVDGGVFQFLP